MSLIDWSDPEVMLSLLREYVEDERSESHDDAARLHLLGWLLREIAAVEEHSANMSGLERMESLRAILSSVEDEFHDDPVVKHVEDCVGELERINTGARP